MDSLKTPAVENAFKNSTDDSARNALLEDAQPDRPGRQSPLPIDLTADLTADAVTGGVFGGLGRSIAKFGFGLPESTAAAFGKGALIGMGATVGTDLLDRGLHTIVGSTFGEKYGQLMIERPWEETLLMYEAVMPMPKGAKAAVMSGTWLTMRALNYLENKYVKHE